MTGKFLNIALWAAQIILALAFGFFGYTKATGDLVVLSQMMSWIPNVPPAFVRFVGIAEIAGAVGLILPWLLRIMPRLTPLAALGLATIQVLAIALHAVRGETAHSIWLNLPLLTLSLFVLWGRSGVMPFGQRATVTA